MNGRQKFAANQAAAAAALRSASKIETPSTIQQTGCGFAVGDYVKIKGQNSIGKIENITGSSAKVLFGMMYMQVPLKRLELTDKPKQTSNLGQVATFISKETRDAMYEKKLHFKPEIDIRGMHVDEALNAVSYFIDDAIQLEQAQVRILHGTGTGALRELVRNYVRTVAGVKHFRATFVLKNRSFALVLILTLKRFLHTCSKQRIPSLPSTRQLLMRLPLIV